MICNNCGFELKDQFVKFCPKCGTKLKTETITREERLQRALVPDYEHNKSNPDEIYLSFTINNNIIGLDYAKSMYIKIRKPMEGIRSKWKYRTYDTIIANRRAKKYRSYTEFSSTTVDYYNSEKDKFINEVLDYFAEHIKQWPAFVRDNYREAIEERINYRQLKRLIRKLDCDRLRIETEEIAAGMRTSFESNNHSQAFYSYGGLGISNSILGALTAEAANYAVDAAGAAIEYARHVAENIKAKKFLNDCVRPLETAMVASCDNAANIVFNYCISNLLTLCNLPSIDTTVSTEIDDFNRVVAVNSKQQLSEKKYIKNACTLLSQNPYDLSIIKWLYAVDPMLDEDILKYSKVLGIEDIIEDLIDDVERSQFHSSCWVSPLRKDYNIYRQF